MTGLVGRAWLVALMAVVLLGRDASAATGVGGATWTPAQVSMVVVASGFRVPRDSVYVFLRLTWDKAGVRALRRYEADNLRYTQELNDLSGRLSATGHWMSDLPGASYDRDDDDEDGRWEELEVTVTQARAIKAGRQYVVGFQLTRWYQACGGDGGCRWRWSRKRAQVAALSQLSRHFLGEWQAMRWTAPYASVVIPRQPRPAAPRRDEG